MRLVLRLAKGYWIPPDYDVLYDGRLVGRIYRVTDHPDSPWFWSLLTRPKRYGTADTLEQAMAAFEAGYERWLKDQPKT
jgi:hypothetical protein